MDSSRDEAKLAAALEEVRPKPSSEFAEELDQRAAAGFPRRSRLGRLAPSALLERLRATPPRRVLLPVGAVATVAVIGAVVVGNNLGGSADEQAGSNPPGIESFGGVVGGSEEAAESAPSPEPSSSAVPEAAESPDGGALLEGRLAEQEDAANTKEYSTALQPRDGAASKTSKRSVERSATMAIATPPGGVSDAASQVFDVVHANNGIVLNSAVSDGSDEDPGAEFELLIPSGRLGDALASFSGIGEVLSREESTADITAPTVGTADRLKDSRARIDSLLGQLAEAGSEEEREAVERELRAERRRAARLRERLTSLKRRANLSRVSLRIASDGASGGGGWSVGDALDDAGTVLAVALSVAIVVLAVLAPLALVALLVWLARRAWLHRARARALG